MNAILGGHLKFLAKDTAVYGIASAFNKALALVTFPILARQLNVEEFGLLDTLNTAVVVLSTFLIFGQDSAVARFFYDSDDRGIRRQVVSQSLVIQLAMTGAVVPVVWLAGEWLVGGTLGRDDGRLVVVLAVLQAPFLVLLNFSQNILKWTLQRQKFILVSVGATVGTAAALIVSFQLGAVSLTAVMAIFVATRVCFAAIGLWYVREWLAPPSGWLYVRPMLRYAIPLGLVAFASSLQPLADRTFVLVALDATQLGQFAVATKLAGLLSLPISAFQVAWGPFALSRHRDATATLAFQWSLRVLTLTLLAAVLVITSLAVPLTELLASSKYQAAPDLVFLLALGLTVSAVGGVTELGIGLSKRTYLKVPGYLLAIATALLVMSLTIPTLGILGAGIGTLCGHCVRTAVDTIVANRVFYIDWKIGGVIGACGLTAVTGAMNHLLLGPTMYAGIAVVPVIGLVALGIYGWYAVMSSSARSHLMKVLVRWQS